MNDLLRAEAPDDVSDIHAVAAAAFRTAAHSSHTEHYIVDALRARGELSVSRVAVQDGQVIGHVAVSPVAISDGSEGWFGLGPLSVAPQWQGQGIGSGLMRAALDALRGLGARGCVVLGEPDYYGRFGFRSEPGLVLPGVPPEYFQALRLEGPMAHGEVSYSPAFEAGRPG
ncbi:GNAT family N-acetyltransferase [Stenotrophomonas sp. NPDC077659]|uniref:GNAT family N-acetyltransferase n=1 Tax=Stenotrophomonas sp. NPDC077659 TaxID=3390694 RepID=UPI003CFDD80C